MKNRKWLLIVILAVVILNVAIFVALRLTKVDLMVKDRITKLLREQAGLMVEIGDFDFNDKQVNVSNIAITSLDGTISGVIRQIYVEYDLFSLVAHRFKDFSSISMIHIYNPSFSVDYTPNLPLAKVPNFCYLIWKNTSNRHEYMMARCRCRYTRWLDR